MSSNRYSEGNRKGFSKTQRSYYAPKANQTLSNSLRESSSSSRESLQSGGGGGVKAGDGGSWVSTQSGIQTGNFVNYLPQDEAVASGLGADEGGLDPVESQRVVDLLNRELSRLLKSKPRDFWKEVASDTSLHAFLESFLKYKSRWYDFPYRQARGIVAGVIVGDHELCRRVFMVLYRISSNRDPNAKIADSLSSKDHTALLQEKKLLDLPKLLDICALYGHENEDLTKVLVENAINAQPWLHSEFTEVSSQFLSIVRTMYQRCSSSLEVLFSSTDLQGQPVSRLRADYLEVMDFINDAVVNMDAFVSAYKHAAVFFCCPVEMSDGNEELLTTLARLHDSLLPSLQKGLRVVLTSGDDAMLESSSDLISDVLLSIKLLSMRIINFSWKLLYSCYLSEEAFEKGFSFPTAMKMFPANVDDPVIRTEILVQMLRDISLEHSEISGGVLRGTFLQSMEKNHKIISRVQLLQNTGWMSIDDEQSRLLSGILGHTLEVKSEEKSHLPSPGIVDCRNGEEDAAILESKISQIKDLFPDYGKGFLAACLEVYNHNPEDVIQRILEGTLHEDLQSLDMSSEQMPQQRNVSTTTSGRGKGKGKEKCEDYVQPVTDQIANEREASSKYSSSSFSALGRLAYQPETLPASSSSSSTVGRFIRKATTDSLDEKSLDSKDKEYMVKNSALISQLEYEDEYDDSFDDLGLSVGDSGLEETESLSNKLSYDHGKSQESDSGSSSSAKWNSRKKPQYYVKDGKNYSYKVQGSVPVNNYGEATLMNQTQKDLIHGLGRGGNLPIGAVRRMDKSRDDVNAEPEVDETAGRGGRANSRGRGRRGVAVRRMDEANEEVEREPEVDEVTGRGGRGNPRGRGRRGGGVRRMDEANEEVDGEPEVDEVAGRGGRANPRGGGRRGGGRHHRKNLAMKKHFQGVMNY